MAADSKKQEKLDLSQLPKSISATIDGQSMIADLKTFSTGSTGYHATGKIKVGELKCQVNVLVTVIGSKPEATKAKKK